MKNILNSAFSFKYLISLHHTYENELTKYYGNISLEMPLDSEYVMAAKYSFLPTDTSTPERYTTNVPNQLLFN